MITRRTASAPLLAALLFVTGCHHMRFPQVSSDYREYAYVTNGGAGTVTVLDLVNFRPDRTLRVGNHPTAVAVNPLRNEVYVVNTDSGTVSVIDAAANTVTTTIPVHKAPHGIAVDPKGVRAYVANSGANTISVLDVQTHREIATVGTGEQPGVVAVAPDGRTLIVSNHKSGSVSVYNINTTPAPRFRAAFDHCPEATDVAILPDSSKAFITCTGSGEVLSIALATEPGSWAAKQDPTSMQDHLLDHLRVGKAPVHLALKPDGGELFVSNFGSDSISEISTFTNEVGGTYPIGSQPSQGVIAADNSSLWVSNSGAESVSLYSIDEGRMSNAVHTGPQPDAIAMSPGQPVLLVADAKSGDVAVIRTKNTNGPDLLTMLPVGPQPTAIGIKAFHVR